VGKFLLHLFFFDLFVNLIDRLGSSVLPSLSPAVPFQVNNVLQQEPDPGGGLLIVHEFVHLLEVIAHVAESLDRALGQPALGLDVQVLAHSGHEAAETLQGLLVTRVHGQQLPDTLVHDPSGQHAQLVQLTNKSDVS